MFVSFHTTTFTYYLLQTVGEDTNFIVHALINKPYFDKTVFMVNHNQLQTNNEMNYIRTLTVCLTKLLQNVLLLLLVALLVGEGTFKNPLTLNMTW